MVEIGLATLLNSTPAISALVSNRIFPVALPADWNNQPSITYQSVSSKVLYNFDGSKVITKRLDFDVWSQSYLSSKTLQLLIIKTLVPFTGLLSTGEMVICIEAGSEIDSFETDSRTYRNLAEIIVTYSS
jgi:hypothetical protein